MRDTAELAPFLDYWRQRVVFSQTDVLDLMRTIRSLPSMFPKGGNALWGDAHSAPDDNMEGEADEPDTLPTLDYPGSGVNRSFVTSQATAERRDKSKYEDVERIKESAERKIKDVGAVEREKAFARKRNSSSDSSHSGTIVLSNADLPVTYSSSSYLGQFLSFTTPVPWPFPNITRVVDEFLRENRGNITEISAGELKKKVEQVADTGREPKMNDKDNKQEHNGQRKETQGRSSMGKGAEG